MTMVMSIPLRTQPTSGDTMAGETTGHSRPIQVLSIIIPESNAVTSLLLL